MATAFQKSRHQVTNGQKAAKLEKARVARARRRAEKKACKGNGEVENLRLDDRNVS